MKNHNYIRILNTGAKCGKVPTLNFAETLQFPKIIIEHPEYPSIISSLKKIGHFKSYIRFMIYLSIQSLYRYRALLLNSKLAWMGVCNLLPVHQILVFASINRTGSCPVHKVMRYEPNVGTFKGNKCS